jgi:hypothetical protein
MRKKIERARWGKGEDRSQEPEARSGPRVIPNEAKNLALLLASNSQILRFAQDDATAGMCISSGFWLLASALWYNPTITFVLGRLYV